MKIHLMLALQTVWVPPYLPEVQNNVIQNQNLITNCIVSMHGMISYSGSSDMIAYGTFY